jgi:hypothetical protein
MPNFGWVEYLVFALTLFFLLTWYFAWHTQPSDSIDVVDERDTVDEALDSSGWIDESFEQWLNAEDELLLQLTITIFEGYYYHPLHLEDGSVVSTGYRIYPSCEICFNPIVNGNDAFVLSSILSASIDLDVSIDLVEKRIFVCWGDMECLLDGVSSDYQTLVEFDDEDDLVALRARCIVTVAAMMSNASYRVRDKRLIEYLHTKTQK